MSCSAAFQATLKPLNLIDKLAQRLKDSDDGVRTEAVQALLTLSTHGRATQPFFAF